MTKVLQIGVIQGIMALFGRAGVNLWARLILGKDEQAKARELLDLIPWTSVQLKALSLCEAEIDELEYFAEVGHNDWRDVLRYEVPRPKKRRRSQA